MVVYIHGAGGSSSEAEFYREIFSEDVIGLDYKSNTPWDFKEETKVFFEENKDIVLIANSIGAYFAMLCNFSFRKAFLISPVVDMKRLIEGMMRERNISLKELEEKKVIADLSWDYYTFACNNIPHINSIAHIAYGEFDNLTSLKTISSFAKENNATLDILKNGEHYFHTPEEMDFLANWISKYK